jgi:hypothetical protein
MLGCAGKRIGFERHPAYMDASVEFTFLRQLQLKLAVCVGKLPMVTHQVMKQVGACVVHALQKV